MEKRTWYESTMNNIHKQGLIIDELTGENIAVTYKQENAALISAAPDLLEACQAIAALADGQGRMNMIEVSGMARAAIAKAKGE